MKDRSGLEPEIKDKMTDALLEYAGACHVDNMAGFMDETYEAIEEGGREGKIVVPPSLDERMTQFIRDYEARERRRSTGRKIRKGLTKAAVILLIIGGSLGVLTTVSQAARVKIFNFIIDTKEKFTQINFQEQGGGDGESSAVAGIPKEWDGVYVPIYIPEGFRVVKTEELNAIKVIDFENNEGRKITFDQGPVETGDLQVDTESAEAENFTLTNGEEGLLVEKNGYITLVWHNNEALFFLSAQLEDRSEVFKIAESIKKQR